VLVLGTRDGRKLRFGFSHAFLAPVARVIEQFAFPNLLTFSFAFYHWFVSSCIISAAYNAMFVQPSVVTLLPFGLMLLAGLVEDSGKLARRRTLAGVCTIFGKKCSAR